MLVIGLTGGIGSGKSQASGWFEAQGIDVIDADILARDVVKKGSPTLAKIVAKFGDWVLDSAGELDRRAVREYVFNRPQALMDLEQITHPAIRHLAQQLLKDSQSPYTILVAPLLLEGAEAGLASLCDRVMVVDTTEALQLERASQRDGQDQAKIKHIMANQLSREARLAKADDVVENNGSLEALYLQLASFHQRYLAMAN
ncbi:MULTISPECIES: dephospho-CoA kinase [unclassified Moraxella]|uniref:dephospho-CoA kinase n=1 Tax=unclassified Moraxella TaxID=2685852 RepID=UPI003AF77291